MDMIAIFLASPVKISYRLHNKNKWTKLIPEVAKLGVAYGSFSCACANIRRPCLVRFDGISLAESIRLNPGTCLGKINACSPAMFRINSTTCSMLSVADALFKWQSFLVAMDS